MCYFFYFLTLSLYRVQALLTLSLEDKRLLNKSCKGLLMFLSCWVGFEEMEIRHPTTKQGWMATKKFSRRFSEWAVRTCRPSSSPQNWRGTRKIYAKSDGPNSLPKLPSTWPPRQLWQLEMPLKAASKSDFHWPPPQTCASRQGGCVRKFCVTKKGETEELSWVNIWFLIDMSLELCWLLKKWGTLFD